jgi:hypothetical protein
MVGYLAVDEVYPTVAVEMDNRGVLFGLPDVGDTEAYCEILANCIPKEIATLMNKSINSGIVDNDASVNCSPEELMCQLMTDLSSQKASVTEIVEIMDLHSMDNQISGEEEQLDPKEWEHFSVGEVGEKGPSCPALLRGSRSQRLTENTHNMASFLPLDTPKALGLLNSHLGNESYINGYALNTANRAKVLGGRRHTRAHLQRFSTPSFAPLLLQSLAVVCVEV